MNDQITIHISYAGEDLTDILLAEIKSKLLDFNIIDYKSKSASGERYSINDFIDEIGTSGYVITIISEKYLTKSEYCQKEIRKLMQNDNINERVFPIFVENIPDLYEEDIKNSLIDNAQDFIRNHAKKIKDQKEKRKFNECYLTIEDFINKLKDTSGWTFKHNEINKLVDKIKLKIHGSKRKNLYASIEPISKDYLYRTDEMENIKKIIADKNSNNKIGIWGMGGVGKTSFAIEIANNKYIRKQFLDGIYFISLGQTPDFHEAIGKLLDLLGEESDTPSLEKLQKAFEHLNALLIIDNVWSVEDLSHFKINASNTKILITTRRENILKSINATEYELNTMSYENCFKMLEKKIGLIPSNNIEITQKILRMSGFLPLAIDIIGSMISRDKDDIDLWKDILRRLEDADLKKIYFERENNEHKSLFKVIDVSVQYLEPEIRNKYLDLKVLNLYFSIEKATLKIFFGEDVFYDTIFELISSALVKKTPGSTYKIHDLQKLYIEKYDYDTNDQIYNRLLIKYIEKYDNRWFEIDNSDIFFFDYYPEMCDLIQDNLLKKRIAEDLLFKKKFLSLHYVKSSINILGYDSKIKKIAEILLKSKYLHFTTIIWIIKLLGKDNETVKQFVTREYLKRDIHPDVTVIFLSVLGDESEEAQAFSKKYLEQDMKYINQAILSKCLNILGDRSEEAQVFSRKYLNQDIKYLYQDPIIKCLTILGNKSEEAQAFSKKYLSLDFKNVFPDATIKCLNILGDKSIEVQIFSKKYLYQDIKYLYQDPIIKCLTILGNKSEEAQAFSKKYLLLDFKDVFPDVTLKCLNVLGNTFREIHVFSEKYIEYSTRNANYNHLTQKCLTILGDESQKAQIFSKKYLSLNLKDINPDITVKSLVILGEKSREAQIFSKKYLLLNITEINFHIMMTSLLILSKKLEITKNFSKRYPTSYIVNVDSKTFKRCLSVMGENSKDVKIFSEKYMKMNIKNYYIRMDICLHIISEATNDIDMLDNFFKNR